MKIVCVGVGYVGLVAAVCLADQGNDVTGVDVMADKIADLNEGKLPIYEPGLGEILQRNLREKRITFSTDMKSAIEQADVVFICVGTPSDEHNRADLKYVLAVAKDIGTYMKDYLVVVDKSTVPVGTADVVKETILKHQPSPLDVDVVSNPEFLREGEAVLDFTLPDRIIIGADSQRARDVMQRVYEGIARTDHPLIFTDVKSAEVIKYASNALLATKISFMNELSHLCEHVGADIKEVAKGMGLDERIGPRFLQAGIGYGGSCFPKDVKALIHTMTDLGLPTSILSAVEDVNERQKHFLVPKIKEKIENLKGKTLAVWGLSFKPKTDDMREAPSLVIINALQQAGAQIAAYDPVATKNAQALLTDVEFYENAYDALKDADALIILTEWNEFRNVDKQRVKQLLKTPLVFDGRNMYNVQEMKKLGFDYVSVGR